jgi:hypothetical protein
MHVERSERSMKLLINPNKADWVNTMIDIPEDEEEECADDDASDEQNPFAGLLEQNFTEESQAASGNGMGGEE